MKPSSLFALILMLVPVTNCAPVPEQSTPLEPCVIEAANVETIQIQIDSGELRILQSVDHSVRINGQTLFSDSLEYQINSIGNQITIVLLTHQDHTSRTPLDVSIEVPEQVQVNIITDKASVWVQEYHGDVEINSTSGNVTIEQTKGSLMLNSNRGNITVQDSSGIISVVGNYGTLSLINTEGETGVSTIMGNIDYEGSIQPGDSTRLETDHGAVTVNLKDDSALMLQVRSTSGDVTCMIPNMSATSRTCEGVIGSGGGSLSIRTVSGSVTLQLTP